MANQATIKRYFDALLSQDGAPAASLFREQGVIDDYRGRRHLGRAAITAFINQVSERDIEFLSAVIHEPPRSTVYARMTYPDGRVAMVRWIFHAYGDLIDHVGNTNVEQVPPALLLPTPTATLLP